MSVTLSEADLIEADRPENGSFWGSLTAGELRLLAGARRILSLLLGKELNRPYSHSFLMIMGCTRPRKMAISGALFVQMGVASLKRCF